MVEHWESSLLDWLRFDGPHMTERIAVFPGSFDPLTNGHTDIVSRALRMFDRVKIAILSNPTKDGLFSIPERTSLIKEVFAEHGSRVSVESFSGLLVDYVRQVGGIAIVRGLRAISDYDYEAQMALMNKSLYPQAETVFLISQEKNSYISSSLVRQVASLGGDVSGLVPGLVLKALKGKLGK